MWPFLQVPRQLWENVVDCTDGMHPVLLHCWYKVMHPSLVELSCLCTSAGVVGRQRQAVDVMVGRRPPPPTQKGTSLASLPARNNSVTASHF